MQLLTARDIASILKINNPRDLYDLINSRGICRGMPPSAGFIVKRYGERRTRVDQRSFERWMANGWDEKWFRERTRRRKV